MIVPERVSRKGRVVPAFQIDDEFAAEVMQHRWWANGPYLRANVGDGRRVLMHKFVWSLRHGECDLELDHINRDGRDNRIENLRPATKSLNNLNKRVPRNCDLPPGVYLADRCRVRKYRSYLMHRGKRVSLGYFATPEEASSAYEAERRRRQAVEEQVAREFANQGEVR